MSYHSQDCARENAAKIISADIRIVIPGCWLSARHTAYVPHNLSIRGESCQLAGAQGNGEPQFRPN